MWEPDRIDVVSPRRRLRLRPLEVRRLLIVAAVTPVIAFGAAATINADIGVGPIDVAILGIADTTDLAVGTASMVLATALVLLGWIGGVPPGPGTLLVIPIFGPVLTAAVDALPQPDGVAAVAQFAIGLAVAATFVAVVVAADVGVAPPEAVMLAAHRLTGRPLGPIRIVEDCSLVVVGLALGAPVGPGTVVVAVLFGPIVARVLPPLDRVVARVAPRTRG